MQDTRDSNSRPHEPRELALEPCVTHWVVRHRPDPVLWQPGTLPGPFINALEPLWLPSLLQCLVLHLPHCLLITFLYYLSSDGASSVSPLQKVS